MHTVLQTLDRQLHTERGRRWVVAYSGGLDSTVLLHGLCQLPSRPAIHAVHVHHGLQSQADDWQRHCRAFAESLGVAFASTRVTVDTGDGLEAAARDARYRAFASALDDGDLLLQAHHLDDQAETVLLRLFRGTGPDGLQGIPRQRSLVLEGRGAATVLRPLLELPRTVLEDYARDHQLEWVEDPSNADPAMDRNYLRHRVLPVVAERWPGYRKALGRFAGLAAPRREHADDISGFSHDSARRVLEVSRLRALDEARRNRALRQWMSHYQLRPSAAQLAELQRVMLWSAADGEPVLAIGDWQVRRYQDRLYLTSLTDFDARQSHPWNGLSELDLPGAGTLSVNADPEAAPLALEVRFRQGGERCQPAGRGQSQRLKKLLQDAQVPPWRRDRLPLLYLDGELAAVADLWRCHGFEEALSGRVFHWQPAE